MARMSEFMVKLGETEDGKIIEVPDIILFGLVLFFIVFIFSINSNEKK